jgi:putative heme-binding domain-containing protein
MRTWLRTGTLALAAGSLLAQHNYTPGDVDDGARLFIASCANCHGPEGDAVPNVDLAHGKFKRAVTDGDLVGIIRSGIPGTAMPPNSFSDFQSATIVAYLRSMAESATAGPSVAGDAAKGKVIFEGKGGCQSCHRVMGVGSRLGPDLSEIGTIRRALQLQRSLIDPDFEVLPQNRYVRVVAKDGTSTTGRLLNQDTLNVQMLDSKEQMRSFAKQNLKEFAFIEKSPMPSFQGKLSPQELADVVSYLASLKGIVKK